MTSLRSKLDEDNGFTFANGVYHQRGFGENQKFEKEYLAIRQKENRLYPDDQVRLLPDIDTRHPLSREWKMRNRSLQRIKSYIANRVSPCTILEVGCGNGWLSANLSGIGGEKSKAVTEIVGLDINLTELQQASRVFSDKQNVCFVYGDAFTISFPDKFDLIMLASSVQYFESLPSLINRLLLLLRAEGEIHIFDSPIYKPSDVPAARKRTEGYFNSLDSGMHHQYFHHDWKALDDFKYDVLRDPSSINSRISRAVRIDSPFPWIRISKSNNPL